MALTPMMQQYLAIKERYKDCIVFYRLGDFYEMFFEDAEVVSSAIGLTLTGRECGLEKKAPMCGIPHHVSATYIKKLVDKGFKIAMVEQLSLPEKGKKMVERDVVKVISAGTMSDETFLSSDKSNYIAAVYEGGSVSWCDVTTGHFYSVETKNHDDVLAMINPAEVIRSDGHYGYAFKNGFRKILDYFGIMDTSIFDFDAKSPVVASAGALLEYLMITQKKVLPNITRIQVIKSGERMILDKLARENLELLTPYREAQKKGSLLWVLDETKTSMGARELSRWVSAPLQDVAEIENRLDGVEEIKGFDNSVLSKIVDIGRLCGKIASGDIGPRECISLANSLGRVSDLKRATAKFQSKVLRDASVNLNELTPLVELIKKSISDEPAIVLSDGGYIRAGYNERLDEYRASETLGRTWIAKLEAKEREECGIKELKIGFNRISGYYFEVPLRLTDKVPYRFTRRATTANTERYITGELKEIEEKITGASEKAIALEFQLYTAVRKQLQEYLNDLLTNAESVATIDVLQSLAIVAVANRWTRPKFGSELNLKKARHPVIEKLIGEHKFIPNDCYLKNNTAIITGPNMAGKSTYMRMVALNVLLAHIGSFVPASNAVVPLTDRIFTRIGASDSMLTGQSTFMVELNDTSRLIHGSTKNSLILLDELGRGTGTQEGRALASAIISYITDKIGAMTLFATHFHELAELANSNPKIKNYRALTSIIDGEIVFLHKIEPGKEEQSFGIDVAKLAGIPKEIIDEARRLYSMDRAQQLTLSKSGKSEAKVEAPKNKEPHSVVEKLQGINPDSLSPMEALIVLGDLVKETKN